MPILEKGFYFHFTEVKHEENLPCDTHVINNISKTKNCICTVSGDVANPEFIRN